MTPPRRPMGQVCIRGAGDLTGATLRDTLEVVNEVRRRYGPADWELEGWKLVDNDTLERPSRSGRGVERWWRWAFEPERMRSRSSAGARSQAALSDAPLGCAESPGWRLKPSPSASVIEHEIPELRQCGPRVDVVLSQEARQEILECLLLP